MGKKITKRDAEKVRDAIAKKFHAKEWGGDLLVQEPGHWADGDAWYVCWEEGPYEWAMDVDNPSIVPGLFVEPYNSFVLAIYPA